jgi:hypothetical protein
MNMNHPTEMNDKRGVSIRMIVEMTERRDGSRKTTIRKILEEKDKFVLGVYALIFLALMVKIQQAGLIRLTNFLITTKLFYTNSFE